MKVRALLFTLLALFGFAGIALAANYDDQADFVGGVGRLSRVVGATYTTADPNPSRAVLRANQTFLVSTTANAVDLDFSNDADLETIDIGTQWTFIVSAGGTNALTITNGASGVVVTTLNTLGTTCEDVGDHLICTAFAAEAVVCASVCAD